MEKENLPLYVHEMGIRRMLPPKEKLTEAQKQELIEEYLITDKNFYEIKEIIKKGEIINYSI